MRAAGSWKPKAIRVMRRILVLTDSTRALDSRCSSAASMAWRWRVIMRESDLPRAFRTAYLWLIHAADCRSRYSSWTCRGVRY